MKNKKIDNSLIKFREACKKDIGCLVEQRLDYLKAIETDASFDTEPWLKDLSARYFSEKIENGSLVVIIAEYEKKLIGWGALIIRNEPPYFGLPDGRIGYIFNMYCLPEYRKNGIGARVLKRLIHKGKNLGLTRFELNTTKDGESLYRKSGFKDSQYPLLELVLRKEGK